MKASGDSQNACHCERAASTKFRCQTSIVLDYYPIANSGDDVSILRHLSATGAAVHLTGCNAVKTLIYSVNCRPKEGVLSMRIVDARRRQQHRHVYRHEFVDQVLQAERRDWCLIASLNLGQF